MRTKALKPNLVNGQTADIAQNRTDKNFVDKEKEKEREARQCWVRGLLGRAYTLKSELQRFATYDEEGFEKLLKSESTEEVERATAKMRENGLDLPPFDFVLECVKDLRQNQAKTGHPKKRDAVINFLADSMASWGQSPPGKQKPIAPRTSRDFVGKERTKSRKVGRQEKIELHIRCACGYTGFTETGACPQCKRSPDHALLTSWLDPTIP
jgi:hypothetical protein